MQKLIPENTPFSIPMSRASPKPLWRSTHQISRSILSFFATCETVYIMGVSKNMGTPKSSILIDLSTIRVPIFYYKPSILGYPYFWKHPYLFHKFSLPDSSQLIALASSNCSDLRVEPTPPWHPFRTDSRC